MGWPGAQGHTSWVQSPQNWPPGSQPSREGAAPTEAELGPNGASEDDHSLGNQLEEQDKGFRRTPHANYSLGDLRSDVGPRTGPATCQPALGNAFVLQVQCI